MFLQKIHLQKFFKIFALPEFSHDKATIDFFAIHSCKLFIAKYTKKDLQKIFRMVLEARAPPSDGLCEKLLKVRLPDIYCSKFHIKCYNFC